MIDRIKMRDEIKNLESLIETLDKICKSGVQSPEEALIYETNLNYLQERHRTLTGRYYNIKRGDNGRKTNLGT